MAGRRPTVYTKEGLKGAPQNGPLPGAHTWGLCAPRKVCHSVGSSSRADHDLSISSKSHTPPRGEAARRSEIPRTSRGHSGSASVTEYPACRYEASRRPKVCDAGPIGCPHWVRPKGHPCLYTRQIQQRTQYVISGTFCSEPPAVRAAVERVWCLCCFPACHQ